METLNKARVITLTSSRSTGINHVRPHISWRDEKARDRRRLGGDRKSLSRSDNRNASSGAARSVLAEGPSEEIETAAVQPKEERAVHAPRARQAVKAVKDHLVSLDGLSEDELIRQTLAGYQDAF